MESSLGDAIGLGIFGSMAATLEPHPGWRPLSRRDDPTYEAPYHGLPRWLTGSLLDWMAPRLRRPGGDGRDHYDVALLREIERRLRRPLSWAGGPAEAYEFLTCLMRLDPDFAFDVVDLLAARESGPSGLERLKALERILEQGGSAWTVEISEGAARLERRS
jgi:hypothetical protein